MSESLTARGIAAMKAGQQAEAYQLLTQAVQANSRDAKAWLWLSGVVDTDADRRVCLENVLALEPQNEGARRGLAFLAQRAQPEPVIKPLPPAPRCAKCGAAFKPGRMFCLQCGSPLGLGALPLPGTTPAPAPLPVPTPLPAPAVVSKAYLLDQKAARLTRLGYQITNRTETAIQAKKDRRWSSIGIVLLALLAIGSCFFYPLFIPALIWLLIVFADYARSGGAMQYITVDHLAQQAATTQANAQQLEAQNRAREQAQAQERAKSQAAWNRRKAWLRARWWSLGRSGQVAVIILCVSGCFLLLSSFIAISVSLPYLVNSLLPATPVP